MWVIPLQFIPQAPENKLQAPFTLLVARYRLGQQRTPTENYFAGPPRAMPAIKLYLYLLLAAAATTKKPSNQVKKRIWVPRVARLIYFFTPPLKSQVDLI